MALLTWNTKKPVLHQADLDLVNKALAGDLKASVEEYVILGDIYQKLDIEDNCNSILPDKVKTVIVKPGRVARRNWGDLYRACCRLYECGEIAGFTLRRNGQLRIKWSITLPRKTPPIPKNTYAYPIRDRDPEYLQPSMIDHNEEDNRITDRHKRVKLDTTPTFKPYDFAPPRLIVEDKLFQDHNYLHSPEARAERARRFKAESSCCDLWGAKFKHNPDYFSDEITARDFDTIFKELCSARGWCAWPSPIYRS